MAQWRALDEAAIVGAARTLLSAEPQIAGQVGCHARTVRSWIYRFNAEGIEGLGVMSSRSCGPTWQPARTGAGSETASGACFYIGRYACLVRRSMDLEQQVLVAGFEPDFCGRR
ncbi:MULTISPECIES: helix-turn-helix domain-containing protein [unclassified Actinoplanes]|uniref:helix-turn-helix domain-containing protein n=1 Tax=unclassified Actinoplanes TaxID=2626549 RepID=UPI0009AF5F5D